MAWAAADDNPFADPSVAAARTAAPSTTNDTPSWLRGGAQPPPPPPPAAGIPSAVPVNGAAARAPPTQAQAARSDKVPQVMFLTRIVNIGLCVLIAATSVVELITLPAPPAVVISVYLFAFACILCCFETHLRMIARIIAGNFGFLYNAKGRTIFLLFVGILCFSLKSILGIISGVAMCVNAVFNALVLFRYPEIEEQQQRKDLEGSTQDFLRRNQGAIARSGMNYASQNPEQAAAAARAASSYV